MKKIIYFLFLSLIITSQSFAHNPYINIIPSIRVGQEVTFHIYFGDIGRPSSVGLNWYAGDNFKGFKAYLNKHGESTYNPISLKPSKKSVSGKFTPKTPGIYQIVAINKDIPVKDLTKYGFGIAKRNKYLRTATEATSFREKQEGKICDEPFMEYDIIPYYAKSGYGDYVSHKAEWCVGEKVYARLFVNKKVAPKKEVKIIGPDGWYVIAKTNDKGEFKFTPYRSGIYYAEYKEFEKVKGTFKEKEYDTIYNHVKLSLTVK